MGDANALLIGPTMDVDGVARCVDRRLNGGELRGHVSDGGRTCVGGENQRDEEQ